MLGVDTPERIEFAGASGLALPFFLLALFPSWLAKMPRSGEWLSRVKVVMGFLVMAAMLKPCKARPPAIQTAKARA